MQNFDTKETVSNNCKSKYRENQKAVQKRENDKELDILLFVQEVEELNTRQIGISIAGSNALILCSPCTQGQYNNFNTIIITVLNV